MFHGGTESTVRRRWRRRGETEMKFYIIQRCLPQLILFLSRVHLTLAKYGQLVNRTRLRYRTSREL